MIDNYSLKARFYPVVILFMPLAITGIFYSFEFKSLTHLFTSVSVVGALTYLFSQMGRDQGKKKEAALWAHWGGCPSVQLLRIRDIHIDSNTKKRIHTKLNQLCPPDSLYTTDLERSDPTIADEVYLSWTKFLISQTRDAKVFSLLLKENTSYGFRRNLWGLKPFALSILFVIFVCNYLFWSQYLESWNPMTFPVTFFYSSVALFVMLLFWLFVITKKWIKIPAFAYAERLLEATETFKP